MTKKGERVKGSGVSWEGAFAYSDKGVLLLSLLTVGLPRGHCTTGCLGDKMTFQQRIERTPDRGAREAREDLKRLVAGHKALRPGFSQGIPSSKGGQPGCRRTRRKVER